MAQESWTTLRDRAVAYLKSSESLVASNDHEVIQNALESIHFAVELALKAAIARNGGQYPDYGWRGHDLEGMITTKFGDQISSVAHKARQLRQTSYINIGLSAWTMDCRYKIMRNHADNLASIGDYKGLYIWIRNNFLQ
jgi:hypothetical protein